MVDNIRFKIKNQDDIFYFTLRERVNEYLSKQASGRFGNAFLAFKGVLLIFLFWGTYYLILNGYFKGYYIAIAFSLLALFGLFLAFNISHDATHNTLTSNKLFNKILFYTTFNPLGMDAYLWGFRHNLSHHIFPNVDDCDADIDSNYLIRLSPNRPLLPHHRFQRFYAPILYLFFTFHWVFIKDTQYLFRKNLANLHDIKHPKLEVVGFIVAKFMHFFYLLYVPIAIFNIEPFFILIGYISFHFTLSYVFLFTNIMNHHSVEADFPQRDVNGYLPGSWAQHQMATCLDFYPTSHVFNFFFGGFNSHCAHHLFPNVCHVHYVEISKIISHTSKQFNIEHKVTTWEHGIVSHFEHLKDLGITPPNPPKIIPYAS